MQSKNRLWPVRVLSLAFLATAFIHIAESRQARGAEPLDKDAAAEEIKALRTALKASDPGMRYQAAQKLGEMDDVDQEVIVDLIALTKDRLPHVRKSAIQALGQIGPRASKAVPTLAKLYTTDPNNSEAIVAALGRMAPESKDALERLIDIARGDTNGPIQPLNVGIADARVQACKCLEELGPAAKPAVPVLIEICKASTKDVGNYRHFYRASVQALVAIGDRRAIPTLKQLRLAKNLHGNENMTQSAVMIADTAVRQLENGERPAVEAKKEPVAEARTKGQSKPMGKSMLGEKFIADVLNPFTAAWDAIGEKGTKRRERRRWNRCSRAPTKPPRRHRSSFDL